MEQVKHLLGVWLFPWKKLNMCKADLSKWLFAGLIQHLNKFSIIYIIKTCLLDVKKISKHSWCMKGGPARSIHAAPHATQNRTPSRSTQQSSMGDLGLFRKNWFCKLGMPLKRKMTWSPKLVKCKPLLFSECNYWNRLRMRCT